MIVLIPITNQDKYIIYFRFLNFLVSINIIEMNPNKLIPIKIPNIVSNPICTS